MWREKVAHPHRKNSQAWDINSHTRCKKTEDNKGSSPKNLHQLMEKKTRMFAITTVVQHSTRDRGPHNKKREKEIKTMRIGKYKVKKR